MMEYADFYDLAVYANETWKGNFLQKEIACNAYNYLMDFEYSKVKGTVVSTIQELIDLLLDDWYSTENDLETEIELSDWLWQLFTELGLTNEEKFLDWKAEKAKRWKEKMRDTNE